MNTNNTLKEELKKYLRGGELVNTSISLETILNEVLDELKNEEKANQEKIQKARELDTISEAILNYFNKYYPAKNDAQKKLCEELWGRDGIEELFKVVANIFEVLSDDNIKSILDEMFNFETAKSETSKSSNTTSFKDIFTQACADLGLDKETSSSEDAIDKFCKTMIYTPKAKKSNLWEF